MKDYDVCGSKKVVKGKRLEILFRLRSLRFRLGLLVLSVLRLPVKVFNWAVDYDGFLTVIKAIPVLTIAAVVLFPWYTFPLWVWAGLTLGVPLCYVVYVLWLTMFALCNIGAAIIGYIVSS